MCLPEATGTPGTARLLLKLRAMIYCFACPRLQALPKPTQQSSSKVQALMPLQVHCPALFTAMLPAVGPFFACPRPLGGVVVAARAPARASGGRLRWRLRTMCTKACAPRVARRRSLRISHFDGKELHAARHVLSHIDRAWPRPGRASAANVHVLVLANILDIDAPRYTHLVSASSSAHSRTSLGHIIPLPPFQPLSPHQPRHLATP